LKILRKITAIFLLTIYLLSATDIRELAKLPMLANHYSAYKSINKNAGLFSFLVMHYYTEDGTDNDAAQDRQLPFKSAENTTNLCFVSVTPPAVFTAVGALIRADQKMFSFPNGAMLPSQYLSSIWQPPRYC
jgi:hypothetical protein